MNQATWDLMKPIAAQGLRDALRLVGMYFLTHGAISNGAGVEAFIGAGMTLGGLFWGWFTTKGYMQVGELLKKLTAAKTDANAVKAAQVLPPAAAVDTQAKALSAQSVASILLIAFALSFLVASGPAFAQGKPLQLRPLTGNIVNDFGPGATDKSGSALDSIATVLAKPFQDIANFIGADADGAVALATAIPNIQDGHGQQCWMAMQSFGAIVKAHPIPITFHIINDYESLRLLGIATNNLCSNVHCTQVFADFTAMAQAASPMPLAIPSLHDLCTKVPQIAVVAPVTVPAAITLPDTPNVLGPPAK